MRTRALFTNFASNGPDSPPPLNTVRVRNIYTKENNFRVIYNKAEGAKEKFAVCVKGKKM